MADDKKKKALSDEALARIKGIAGGAAKNQPFGNKGPKLSGKAQGNASNNSSKRGMR